MSDRLFDYMLRQCVNRQRPFGKIESQGEMARLFGLECKVAPGRETESREQKVACPVFVRTVQPITKVRAFGGVTRNQGGKRLAFPLLAV